MRKITLLLLVSVFTISCGVNKFESEEFKTRTANHKQVAILPPVIQYTNPKTGSIILKKDKTEQMQTESYSLQKHLYQKLLNQKTIKNPITVNFQDIIRTNDILKKNNIQTNQLLEKTPEELSKILGVDAVVVNRVEKEIMIDEKILGVAKVGVQILDVLKGPSSTAGSPAGLVKTGVMKLNSSLNDGKDGFVLWNSFKDFDITLDNLPDDILIQYGNQCARSFPYRTKK
jgi:hypothetical protein